MTMESETSNTNLSLISVQEALQTQIQTATGMNILNIKSEDISEPYVSVISAKQEDGSTKTIRRDTFIFPAYAVVKKGGGTDIHAAVQGIENALGALESVEGIETCAGIKGQAVREDNVNSYAFLEIELEATYGYKCK